MPRMTRFGVSLEPGLLERFDAFVKAAHHRNRSAALREIVRSYLVDRDWAGGTRTIAAVVGLVLHNRSPLTLRRLQLITSAQRTLVVSDSAYPFHDDYTLRVIVLFGPAKALQTLANSLITCRGVLHGNVIPLVPAPPCQQPASPTLHPPP
ncbi:MAG: ribbon-helix-helix protein, CopG family [bacterium]|nr:ribbon-helix-helix protein, CopG family [bacterium]